MEVVPTIDTAIQMEIRITQDQGTQVLPESQNADTQTTVAQSTSHTQTSHSTFHNRFSQTTLKGALIVEGQTDQFFDDNEIYPGAPRPRFFWGFS